jgi:hypothetical protein
MAVFFVGGEAPQPVSAQQRLERRAQRSDGIGHPRLGPQFENEDRSRFFSGHCLRSSASASPMDAAWEPRFALDQKLSCC